MKIEVFTIRNKETNELIFAEGTNSYSEYRSFFQLERKWLDESEVGRSWYKINQHYSFDSEVRYLIDTEMKYIKFSLEEIEIK